MDCATERWLDRILFECEEIGRADRQGQSTASLIQQFWPSVGYGQASLLKRAAVAEAQVCGLVPTLLPRIEELESAHRAYVDHLNDSDAFGRHCAAFWAVDALLPAIKANGRGAKPSTSSPAKVAEAGGLGDLIKKMKLVALDDNGAKIMQIAGDSSRSAEDRMRAICEIDATFYGRKSPDWAELLGVKPPAIRKTDFWRVDRKKHVGEAIAAFREDEPGRELPAWLADAD